MNQSTGQNGNNRVQSFLEALRSKQVSTGTQETGFTPFNGSPEVFGERKKVEEARRAEFLANRQKAEVEIFSATRNSKERRLTEIHERLIILSKRVEKKSPEIRKAVIQQMVRPGRSDETMLDHFQKVIDFIQSRTENSGSWLALYNDRSKKIGTYWNMAKKGGSKFTQALDRNVATSVG
jgi:hypothetical protein